MKKQLKLGDIFRIEEDKLAGDFFYYGDSSTRKNNVPIPKGLYYILDRDQQDFLISDIEEVQEGYYLLGKADIYRVRKSDLSTVEVIDQIPRSERIEVVDFLNLKDDNAL